MFNRMAAASRRWDYPTLPVIDLSQFDAVIESYAVGARKPDPAIYEATADALGVDHRQIAYLDDFDQNLGPATELGWTVIHVTDSGLALAELDGALRAAPEPAAPPEPEAALDGK